MAPKIVLEKVSKIYQSGALAVPAVVDVSFAVAPGELVAIMGPSGSGKSTLMHMIGLLDRPSNGSLLIDGNEIVLSMSDRTLAKLRGEKIGFVFQNFNLLPHLSALENVLLPTIYTSRKNQKTRALDLLQLVGLEHRITHKPSELSGGEKQRVAIARALINDPDIILADEPTGNLDSATGEEIINILLDLQQQGKTILVITHDESIADICPRVIRLLDGSIAQDTGSPTSSKKGKNTNDDKKMIKLILKKILELTGTSL
jgi:putative ABC transport system ATP-binding protein